MFRDDEIFFSGIDSSIVIQNPNPFPNKSGFSIIFQVKIENLNNYNDANSLRLQKSVFLSNKKS